ncbi:hypothetical protein CN470_29320 [Bacillus cereus]|nr:hypothetical protein CN470_29320 [Bacillus cereus]
MLHQTNMIFFCFVKFLIGWITLYKLAATCNANVGRSTSVVSVETGFNVSAEYSITQGDTIDTNRRYAEIRDLAKNTAYRFDLFHFAFYRKKFWNCKTSLIMSF